MRQRILSAFLAAFSLTLSIPSAMAGPPLTCHLIENDGTHSLPFGSRPFDLKGDYPADRLVRDTLELLQTNTPVLQRMETLRRAALYGLREPEAGLKLLEELQVRIKKAAGTGKDEALAWFDAGFLVESYQEVVQYRMHTGPLTVKMEEASIRDLPGADWIDRAIELRGGDPEMEFAATLVYQDEDKAKHLQHLEKAVAGAKEGSLLDKNLRTRFGDPAQAVAELRARM